MILNIFNFAVKIQLFMIQRIQSLYLLIAGIFVAVLFFVPLAGLSGKDGNLFLVYLSGVVSEGPESLTISQKSWLLSIYAGLVLVILAWIMFSYGNRILQIKLSYLAILLLTGMTALIYYYVWNFHTSLGGIYSLKIFFSFPLIAAVFVFLAVKGIARDEKLVKSIDRIR